MQCRPIQTVYCQLEVPCYRRYCIPLDPDALGNFDEAAKLESNRVMEVIVWEGLAPPKRIITIC